MPETALPKASFFGFLSREGRLKNRWAKALQDTDPARALEALRLVGAELASDAPAFYHLWAAWVESFLDPARLRLLNQNDLQTVAGMGAALAKESSTSGVGAQIYTLLLAAHDARGEKQASFGILRRLYNLPGTGNEDRNKYAAELARRGANDEDSLALYLDFLKRIKKPDKERRILDLFEPLCQVNFESSPDQVKKAYKYASELLSRHVETVWINATIAFYYLRVDSNWEAAFKYFSLASQSSPSNLLYLQGSLICRLKSGHYAQVTDLAGKAGKLTDPLANNLVLLAQTLAWLDNPDAAGPVPASLSNLANLGLEKYVEDVAALAVGRLHLLNGDSAKAVAVLLPLSGQQSNKKNTLLHYYAAWAALLSGKAEALIACYKRARTWPVACLYADLDPQAAEKASALAFFKQPEPHSPYEAILKARLALIQGARPPVVTLNKTQAGGMDEMLEALRTFLGAAFAAHKAALMAQEIDQPLYNHLPRPERTFWKGLHALCSDNPSEGITLLEEAANQYGHARSAFVLAVQLAEQKPEKARKYLDLGAGRRTDAKVELLRAYLDACAKQSGAAVERMERLATGGSAQASYALGNLNLHLAYQAQQAGQGPRAQVFKEQAAGAFARALKLQKNLNEDCEILARCAEIAAHASPESITACARMWPEVERLRSSSHKPWLVWHVAAAQLWEPKGKVSLAALDELGRLVEETPPLPATSAHALASGAVGVCMNGLESASIERLLGLIEKLAKCAPGPDVQRFSQLGTAALARRRFEETPENKRTTALKQLDALVRFNASNGLLALGAASQHLACDDQPGAVAVLQAAHPTNETEKQLCAAWYSLLQNHPVAVETWQTLTLPEQAASAAHVWTWQKAAFAFSNLNSDQGYSAMLAAITSHPADLPWPLPIERFLVALCARSDRRSGVPEPLLAALKQAAANAKSPEKYVQLARCAAAVGEFDLALQLWNKPALQQALSTDPALAQECGRFLCHLAARAFKAGDSAGASRQLLKASSFLPR
jgi:hypothetical protein